MTFFKFNFRDLTILICVRKNNFELPKISLFFINNIDKKNYIYSIQKNLNESSRFIRR